MSSDRAVIYVDINGKNPPNKFGVDIFQFILSKTQIMLCRQIEMPLCRKIAMLPVMIAALGLLITEIWITCIVTI